VTGYRGEGGLRVPTPFEYEETENGALPPTTIDGQTIFTNTHFRTELEAWSSILSSTYAGLKLAGRAVQRAEDQLKQAREYAAASVKEWEESYAAFERWRGAMHG
jgi:hypothetical protein